jgi:hypothetical protein
MKLTKEQLFGIIRHTSTFVGGVLVMKGIVDEETFTEITGAIITLVGAIWSVVEKNKSAAQE